LSSQAVYLVATDLDGTVIEEDGTILPEVAEHLTSLQHVGHVSVLATGRRFSATSEVCGLARAVPLLRPDWVMANERDLYALSAAGEWINTEGEALAIQERALLPIARIVREQVQELCQANGLAFSPYQSPEVEQERGFLGFEFRDEASAQAATRIIENYLREQKLDLWPMRNRRAIVLRSPHVGKGVTLLRLSQRLEIPSPRVIAIGDSHNDLDMLDGRYGFCAGCPANAEECVKEAVYTHGGIVSDLPYGRGVIDVLERLLPCTSPLAKV
jgi:HAD superfamily hydrolase (TIGR01484 family)